MRFAVFGATGPSGEQFIEECLDKGHSAIALVRNPDKLTKTHANLTVQKVDILQEETLVPHVQGCDAVISCLGGKAGYWTPCSIYTDSIRTITSAMRKANVKRFVGMSSVGSKYDPGLPWIIRWVLRPFFLRNVLQNMSEMEDYLCEKCQDLDFTVVRPPGLTDLPASGEDIQTAENVYVPNTATRMPRRDVAAFMLNCAVNNSWLKKCVAIGLPPHS